MELYPPPTTPYLFLARCLVKHKDGDTSKCDFRIVEIAEDVKTVSKF
jgi:predicted RNase H-like nuclease